MDASTLVKKVQDRCGLDDRTTAEQLVTATLATLAERIDEGERSDLAGQLPEELNAPLLERHEPAEAFGLDEFCRRTQERASGIGSPKAAVSGVFSVLGEAVSGGELDDVRAQLPAEFSEIFAGAR